MYKNSNHKLKTAPITRITLQTEFVNREDHVLRSEEDHWSNTKFKQHPITNNIQFKRGLILFSLVNEVRLLFPKLKIK